MDEENDEITLEQIKQTTKELAAKGLIYDTGERRNGQIVWALVPEKKN